MGKYWISSIAILTINMKTFTRVIFFICYFSHLGVEGSVLIKTPKKTWIAKMKKGNPSNQRKTPHSRASMKDYYLQLEKKECNQKYKRGFKHSYKPYTDNKFNTSSSVDGCFEECRKKSWCNSVSYRDSNDSVTFAGNCILHVTKVEKLRELRGTVRTSIEKNSLWNIYKIDRGSSCSRNRSSLPSECIQRYRNSYKHYTYRNYKTSSSVDGCFEECKKISWCNSVSYTYVSYIKLPGNCLLSDTRVENLRDPEDFNKNSFWTIYRVDRGSSCSRNRTKIASSQNGRLKYERREFKSNFAL